MAVGPDGAPVTVTVQLFNSKWEYIKETRSTGGGVYRFNGLVAGSYYLQASDNKQSWDIKRLARTDASVSVGAGQSAQRDITMHRGAFVTGVAKTRNGSPARRATIRAVSQYGASFTTIADNRGRFAVGGLPGAQRYSVYAWDKKNQYVGKSKWRGTLKAAKGRNIAIRLRTHSAAYAGILRVNDVPTAGVIKATIGNWRTGQWVTAMIVNGDLSRFKGLYPGGGYVLQVPETDQILAKEFALPATSAGRTTLLRLKAVPQPPCPKPTATMTSTVTPTVTATVTVTNTLILGTPAARGAVAERKSCPTIAYATVKANTTATATVTRTTTVTVTPSPTSSPTSSPTGSASTTPTGSASASPTP